MHVPSTVFAARPRYNTRDNTRGGEDVRVVYADAVFFENLLIDYILLVCASRLTGIPVRRWRAALAAGLGGAYAILCALEPGSFLTALPVKAGVGLLMVAAVFGLSGRLIRVTLVFFGVSAAFAGAILAAAIVRGRTAPAIAQISFGSLLLAFSLFYALFTAAFRAVGRHRVRGEILKLTVTLGERRVTVSALADSGNGLREPMSGLPVTVCSLDSLLPLFDPRTAQILREDPDPARALNALAEEQIYRFFLVPYSAVGVPGGMLLAFRPDSVRVGLREAATLIAIDPAGLREGAGYCAVTNV